MPAEEKEVTCGQRLKRCLAFDRWATFISGLTVRLIKLKWVVLFLFTELFLGLFYALFYQRFHQVAEFGWPSKNAQTYVMLGGFRVAITLFGLYAMINRSLILARVFYFPLIFNFFAGLACMRPILLLDCRCTSWDECFALSAFASEQEPIHNPFSYPVESRFDGERKVPMVSPPQEHPEEKATPSLLSRSQQYHQASRPAAEILLQQDQSAASPLARQLHSSSTEVVVTADGVAALRRHGVASKLTGGDEVSGETWEYFKALEDGLGLVATDHQECNTLSISADRKAKLVTLTASLRKGEVVENKADEMPWIRSQLWLCLQNSLCSYIHFSLTDDTAKACQVTHTTSPTQVQTTDETWFGKDMEAAKETLSSAQETSRLNEGVFPKLPANEAMKVVTQYHEDGCHCSDDTSCRIYTNIHGQDRFWCWVAKEAHPVCAARGVKLFWSDEEQKYWGTDLCRLDDCKCTGIGQTPAPSDRKHELNKEGLWDNEMNYGSQCRKWHTDDAWPWCFVGFDSICPDRRGERTLGDTTWQWRSQLPCDKEPQVAHVTTAAAFCENASVASEIIILVLLIGFLPMYQAVFQFVSNRCVDHTFALEQFQVEWSDSSSDSESEAGEAKDAVEEGS